MQQQILGGGITYVKRRELSTIVVYLYKGLSSRQALIV